VLRLSRARGVSTGQIIERATSDGGTTLRFEDAGCVFLGPNGCQVHEGRPLACRLYPLARYVAANGQVVFGLLRGHPESAGVFGPPSAGATVERYVLEQGAKPYIRAADRYFSLFESLRGLLTERVAADPDVNEMAVEWPSGETVADVDGAVERHCHETGVLIPNDPEALIDLHIEAVTRWAGNS
jgi:uncharacterized protein